MEISLEHFREAGSRISRFADSGFQPCPKILMATSSRLFAQIVVLTLSGIGVPEAECPGSTVLMAEKPSQVTCAECQRLLKDYADASLKRVRAHGNLKLA